MNNVSLAQRLAELPKEEREQILDDMSNEELNALTYDWRFWGRPEQFAPGTPNASIQMPTTWVKWLYLAGRGAGKTRSGAEWIRERVDNGQARNIALVAPTTSDARDVMMEGDSGLLNIFPPHQQPLYEPSKRKVTFYNGSIGHIYSADKPDRLRGPQHDTAWADELAAWRYPEAWDMLMFGLRLGNDPKVVITTTPKPKAIIRELIKDPSTVITKGSTYDNIANLAPAFIQTIIQKYEGTTLGQQELHAVILDEAPGALWKRKTINRNRKKTHPRLKKIVVGIDPNVKSTETSDECGIIVAGLGEDNHGYVLSDYSERIGPEGWRKKAVQAYHHHKANYIVPEVNNGGDLVAIVINNVDPRIPIVPVSATRGKMTRAEPVGMLYEQNRVHHVGLFEELEDQMCTWVPGETDSPDRMDALVWAITFLMLAEVPQGDGYIEYEDRMTISPM